MGIYVFEETFRIHAAYFLSVSELTLPPRVPGKDIDAPLGNLTHAERTALGIRVCQVIERLQPADWREAKAFEKIRYLQEACKLVGWQLPVPNVKYIAGESSQPSYLQIGNGRKWELEQSEEAALLGLIEAGGCCNKAKLLKLTQGKCSEPHKVLRKLVAKHPAFSTCIFCADAKGRGGYATTIIRA